MIRDDGLEQRLRAWGRAYGVLPEPDPADERDSDRASATARLAVDATRTAQVSWRRDGIAYTRSDATRRRIQLQVGQGCHVPSWAGGDPVRAPSTRSYGSISPVEVFPDDDEIERLVLSLQALDRRAALALRACYCLLGRRPLKERIAWVAEKSDTKVSRTAYQAAVARGRMQIKAALLKGARRVG